MAQPSTHATQALAIFSVMWGASALYAGRCKPWRDTDFADGCRPDDISWEPIRATLDGRVCYLCFDSDSSSKPNVGLALRRLANFLAKQGALVSIIRLPDAPGGGKQGADDLVASEGARAFENLVAAAELHGSAGMAAKLQAALGFAERQLSALARLRRDKNVNSTDLRAAWAIADELGWRRSTGRLGPVEVNLDRIADSAGVSSDTVGKSIKRLATVPGALISKQVKWREGPDGQVHKVLLLDTPEKPDAKAAEILKAMAASFPPKAPHGVNARCAARTTPPRHECRASISCTSTVGAWSRRPKRCGSRRPHQ